ncbi:MULTISPECIES: hypothetical protein [unclassified Massilia]|uniref:hypothetical protein n=1 Tax=unclassified Massilia TaxID=2609279 RepID=UPI001780C389|nr:MULTISPECIES: hypothetical protein [unclassified Massilia]MBD8531079.1 hypothetical protein [Massilia sp. CFBP 13647]MBD8674779.1 hypothetical protein [Massilia sp. CFBP 13721]
MNKNCVLFLALVLLSFGASAGVDCDKLNADGEDAANIVPDFGSGRDIVGTGRVQLYWAPDNGCKMNDQVLVSGDMLFAHFTYKGFTKVSFIAMKKGDRDVTGWVISSRLRENGKGIVPGSAW